MMLPDYFEFSLPTKVIYGAGILANLPEALKPMGKRRALLVTDSVLVSAGPVDKLNDSLSQSDITIAQVYDRVPPNSTIAAVEECAAQGKKAKCDLVIALGGGSVIDTAKTANLLMVKGGRLEDHMGAYLLDREDKLLPSVIIPTTAGTGSEVTKVAVIADPENDVKLPFTESQFLPDLAVLDPEVTVSMPGKLTAATGMDALTHAVEAYVDREWSPASDALALQAVKLISQHILRACAHPEDVEARGAMLVGSFLAGLAFSHSMVGMAHGIAHALGGVYHIPHGLANALVLPEVMAYNLAARTDRYADIAGAMGIAFPKPVHQSQSLLKSGRLDLLSALADRTEIRRLSDLVGTGSYRARGLAAKAIGQLAFLDAWVKRQTALAGVEKIRTLNRQLAYLTGMPLNLKDAGIADDLAKIEQVATTAMEDGAMLYNPVEPDREDVIAIVKAVYGAKTSPLPVAADDLKPGAAASVGEGMKQVFSSADMLTSVLMDFYRRLRDHQTIGPALLKTNLCIQFRYRQPSAVITIDARGDTIDIVEGDFDGRPEVTMSMAADFAHRFWHGKANLLSALTRRQVTAKGNVPKTVKLLPILKPAYALYPQLLREKGLGDLVMGDGS